MSSIQHLKEDAIFLRKSGKSYGDIIKILKISSKGTLNFWFKGLKLSKRSQQILEKNNQLAHKRGLFKANHVRTEKIKFENTQSEKDGYLSIPTILSHKELTIVGAALYWAEGTKSERTTNRSLSFSNSDPQMIHLYMKFIREVLKIEDQKIRAGIHIYPNMSETAVRKFWSQVTALPIERFYIVTQVSRASKNKSTSILPYGTAVIKINNRRQFYKVKGMIQGIIGGFLGQKESNKFV